MNSFLIFSTQNDAHFFSKWWPIQINIYQFCYTKIIYKVYFNFLSSNKIFLTESNKLFYIYYNEQYFKYGVE